MKKIFKLLGLTSLALCLAGCKRKEIIKGDYEITIKEAYYYNDVERATYIKLGKKDNTKWYESKSNDPQNPDNDSVVFAIRNNSKSDDLVYGLIDGEYSLIASFDIKYIDICFDTYLKKYINNNYKNNDTKILEESTICDRLCKVIEITNVNFKQVSYVDKETNLVFKQDSFELNAGEYKLFYSLEVIEFNTNPVVPNIIK